MRRLLFIAALTVTLLVPPVWSQMHGGGHGMSAGRGGFAPHGSMSFGRGSGFGSRGGAGFHNFGRPFFPNRGFFPGHIHNRFSFSAGFFYPFAYSYPYYYGGGYSYPPPYYYSYPPDSGYDSSSDEERRRLSYEVERLNDEVERLRDREEARSRPQDRVAQRDIRPNTTMLVFKDKHTEEVQNYAVVGETVWIFNEQKARKFPLSDIDLPATTRLNDERGVDFRLSPPR